MTDALHAHAIVHTAKTKGREHSVVVIRLTDGAYGVDRSDVLVIGPKGMK